MVRQKSEIQDVFAVLLVPTASVGGRYDCAVWVAVQAVHTSLCHTAVATPALDCLEAIAEEIPASGFEVRPRTVEARRKGLVRSDTPVGPVVVDEPMARQCLRWKALARQMGQRTGAYCTDSPDHALREA